MASKKLQIVIDAQNNASKEFKRLKRSVKDFEKQTRMSSKMMSKAFGGLKTASVGAGVAIAGATYSLVKFAKEAGKFESVEDAWSGMAKTFGVSSEDLIASVKKATSGTISKFDILNKAVKAGSLIGKDAMGDFGDTMTRMAVLSKKASRATGQDVEFMFESLVTGVGRTSPLILDNLGIVLKTGKTYDEYAQSIGKTSAQLTIAEQKQAILNEVLRQGEQKYKDVAVTSGGLSGALQKLDAEWKDLRIEIGTQVMPMLNELVREILDNKDGIRDFAINTIKAEVVPALKQFVVVVKETIKWMRENKDSIRFFIDVMKAMATIVGFTIKVAVNAFHMFGKVVETIMYGVFLAIYKAQEKWREMVNFIKHPISGSINIIRKEKYKKGRGRRGRRATGGSVMSGNSYLVGENGPEMFTPAVSGSINKNITNNKKESVFNFDFSGATITNKLELINEIKKSLVEDNRLANQGIR